MEACSQRFGSVSLNLGRLRGEGVRARRGTERRRGRRLAKVKRPSVGFRAAAVVIDIYVGYLEICQCRCQNKVYWTGYQGIAQGKKRSARVFGFGCPRKRWEGGGGKVIKLVRLMGTRNETRGRWEGGNQKVLRLGPRSTAAPGGSS